VIVRAGAAVDVDTVFPASARFTHSRLTARHAGSPASASGQTLPIVVLFMLVMLLMCGAVIDLGNVYRVEQALQASADAAVAAGASSLPNTAAAETAARHVSSENGAQNAIPGVPDVTATVTTDCSYSPKFCNPANTVKVAETARVPTYFLGTIGIATIELNVEASACSPCGGLPLDVMIVLDRSGSMSGQKLQNAKDGIKAFLGSMDPAINRVGLVAFQPRTGTNSCATPSTNTYNSSAAHYLFVPLSDDYAAPAGTLRTSSPLVSAVNCVRAGGSTAYANALDAAQAELDANGREGWLPVIILLSDGAANDGPSYLPAASPYRTQPCAHSIHIAAASKAKGVLVYTIAYDLNGAGAQDCFMAPGAQVSATVTAGSSDTPESPAITANQALQQIASPGNYYAQPQPLELVGIFDEISADIARGHSRLTS
jgi:Flp pilus assembly protein TadG